MRPELRAFAAKYHADGATRPAASRRYNPRMPAVDAHPSVADQALFDKRAVIRKRPFLHRSRRKTRVHARKCEEIPLAELDARRNVGEDHRGTLLDERM